MVSAPNPRIAREPGSGARIIAIFPVLRELLTLKLPTTVLVTGFRIATFRLPEASLPDAYTI